MAKVKAIRLSMEITYIPKPSDYPGCTTIEEMAKVDLEHDITELFEGAEIQSEVVEVEADD